MHYSFSRRIYRRISQRLAVLVVALVFLNLRGFSINSPAQTRFPLKLSPNGRYLIDQDNSPFLIKEISAWGLIQALSEADEAAFIDSAKKKQFNTLMVSIISFDTRFAGNPPDWQGIPPFSTKWDFSTFNLEYFNHVDRFIAMARNRGILVLLVPCYLGYKGDGNQGWWDELLHPNNNPAKSLAYGQFLGKRYKDQTNIIWVAGGDNKGDQPLFDHMNNIINGIKESDRLHLWTGHFESAQGTNWSTGNALYAEHMDIDGLYDFTESSLGIDSPQYKTELNQYSRGKMIFQLDQSYEHDIPHGPDNENPQWIRRKNYEGLLSGCAGTSFCPGLPDNTCYTFTNWRPLMNTKGMKEVLYCFNFFVSRPWYQLIPDSGTTLISGGRGSFKSLDYVCSAISSDSSCMIAYLPVGHRITVQLTRLSGKLVRAWWFNPSSGMSILIGTFLPTGPKDFVPATNTDWLLVIDNASKHFPRPGSLLPIR
jgi:hypothetical protein